MDKTLDTGFGATGRGWACRLAACLAVCVACLCCAAQPAKAALQRSWTAVGFFEYVYAYTTGGAKSDASTALSIIKSSASSSVSGIHAYTSIGNSSDASSLYNLYLGLSYLDYCNTIRSSRGLSAFGTNCAMEALSIVMCNYSQSAGGHSNAYSSLGVHEALAWSSASRTTESVYNSWYYSESDSGSHRRNVIGSYNVSGFAIAARGSGVYAHMYEQSFYRESSSDKIYSISSFRQLLVAYIKRCLSEGMPIGSLPTSVFSGSGTVKNGLVLEGGTYYGYSNGKLLKDSWAYFKGKYYHFDSNGALETNVWKAYKGNYYYLGSDGAVATNRWIAYKGKYYYVGSNGIPVKDTWFTYGGKWYYIGKDAALVANSWVSFGGTYCYFGADAALVADTWFKYGGKWYYIGKDGTLTTNTWFKYGGYWFYLDKSGALVTKYKFTYGGVTYWFDEYGRLLAL